MPSYRRERAQSGSLREVIATLEATWPAGLFGERWHDLPAPDDELHGVLVWGPFELALHFRAVAAEEDAVRFALRHGPFTEFRYEARAERHDKAVRLRETVTLDAPRICGGARAARWFAAKLLPSFREAAA
jgi:hypothetical protein